MAHALVKPAFAFSFGWFEIGFVVPSFTQNLTCVANVWPFPLCTMKIVVINIPVMVLLIPIIIVISMTYLPFILILLMSFVLPLHTDAKNKHSYHPFATSSLARFPGRFAPCVCIFTCLSLLSEFNVYSHRSTYTRFGCVSFNSGSSVPLTCWLRFHIYDVTFPVSNPIDFLMSPMAVSMDSHSS